MITVSRQFQQVYKSFILFEQMDIGISNIKPQIVTQMLYCSRKRKKNNKNRRYTQKVYASEQAHSIKNEKVYGHGVHFKNPEDIGRIPSTSSTLRYIPA